MLFGHRDLLHPGTDGNVGALGVAPGVVAAGWWVREAFSADEVAGVEVLPRRPGLAAEGGDAVAAQAAAIGHQALDLAGAIRSRRAIDDLRELARYAAVHQHLDEVAHLGHRIRGLVPPHNP